MSVAVAAQAQAYVTAVYDTHIASLRASSHLLSLDGEEIEVSFDELSHTTHMYSYTLIHLNADFTPDNLLSSEYLQGFTTLDITDYEHSFNTQQLYTHYRFNFPNEDMRPTIGGNYAIIIYEDGRQEAPIATVCLSVVDESEVNLTAEVRSQTDIEFNGRYQQLEVEASLRGRRYISPDEFTLVVVQNGRIDNRITGPRPTYVDGSSLRWQHCRSLIFEGGNEYRHFDIASLYFKSSEVDQIHFDQTYYHAILFPSDIRANANYSYEPDANGSSVINAERVSDPATEADYMFVHFILPADNPWFDGQIYILGDGWYNLFTPSNRMRYNNEHHAYEVSTYLKQGGYEWQYAFVQKGNAGATLQRVEGSHWETGNTYVLYLYHRAPGARYDNLIAIKEVK